MYETHERVKFSHASRLVVTAFLFLQAQLSTLTGPLQDLLAVLVELEFRDDAFRRVDADGDRLTVRLLPGETFNVHDIFESID